MMLLDRFCKAIQSMEGYYKGSRSFRNCNPGNVRFCGQRLATGKDKDGFAIFKTYEDGYATLRTMIYNACVGKSKVYSPNMTIVQFFNKYAPPSDKNDPQHYAITVAQSCGILTSTKIKSLIL